MPLLVFPGLTLDLSIRTKRSGILLSSWGWGWGEMGAQRENPGKERHCLSQGSLVRNLHLPVIVQGVI